MTTAKSFLEVVTNTALIIVCGLLIWFVAAHRDYTVRGSSSPALEGQVLAGPSVYNWAAHAETLVLAVREGCRFCEASMPFYGHLSALQRARRVHAHLLAVMPDEGGVAARYLQARGVDVQGVYNYSLSAIRVSATPTLLLVDAKGRIDKAWVGQLTDAQENDVIATLEK